MEKEVHKRGGHNLMQNWGGGEGLLRATRSDGRERAKLRHHRLRGFHYQLPVKEKNP